MAKSGKKPPITVEAIDLDVLEDMLSFYIRSINIAVSRDLDRQLDGLEVARGTGKITTLLLVDSHPGIRPSVIAQLVLRDKSAMGRLIQEMASHDLLTRRISPKDSRAQELYVTPKGAEVAAKVRRIATAQSSDFFAHIPEEDRAHLIGILRRSYRHIVGLPES